VLPAARVPSAWLQQPDSAKGANCFDNAPEFEEMVAEGKFRQDVFYTHNVMNIHIPALPGSKRRYSTLVQLLSGEYADLHRKR